MSSDSFTKSIQIMKIQLINFRLFLETFPLPNSSIFSKVMISVHTHSSSIKRTTISLRIKRQIRKIVNFKSVVTQIYSISQNFTINKITKLIHINPNSRRSDPTTPMIFRNIAYSLAPEFTGIRMVKIGIIYGKRPNTSN